MRPLIYFTFLFLLVSCGKTHLLKEVKVLDSYPSASAVEFYKGQLFIIGDDARSLLIMDSALYPIDSIMLFPGSSTRIVKESKPDLEAATIVGWRRKPQLMLFGSVNTR